MRVSRLWPLALAVPAASLLSLLPQPRQAEPLAMPPAVAFRILLGIGDKQPTDWSGKLALTGGRVLSIQGWRFSGKDSTDYRSSWKASTRRGVVQAAAAGVLGPMLENGVIVTAALQDAEAQFLVDTSQGSFSFRAADVPFGKALPALGGRVRIDRVPVTLQLTTSPEEQDFPAAAQDKDSVWVAFVEFVHGDRSKAPPAQFNEEPKDLDFLARPVGGDQVFLMQYSKNNRRWMPPVPVTEPGGDIMRVAVAVDAGGRVWVFYSANRENNFDIWARAYYGGKWSGELRLTTDPGPDLNPVAVTDAGGRAWVAWQGFRGDNLEILTAVQQGDKFGPETRVSFSKASDWDPSIAASGTGEVAICWDTYDKGDYDVYCRQLRFQGGIRMEAPVPVAASQNFEARSSVAFDGQGRLWVAYEASDVKWGKDFGAYETTGIALYQGHNLRIKCLEGTRPCTTEADLIQALPQAPVLRPAAARRAAALGSLVQPNPEIARNRAPNTPAQAPPLPLNSFPRLAADGEGLLYLAFRSALGPERSPVGTVWMENLAYFDGRTWTTLTAVPHTDAWLDNRPALIPLGAGRLLMIASSDHRQSAAPGAGARRGSEINMDLYAAEFQLEAKAQAARLQQLPAEKVAPPDPDVKAEVEQVSLMRSYRVEIGGQTYQLLRGEFHRHTEISGDGGRDGPMVDAYRYFIDPAYMDWGGTGDHDNGGGREYSWWLQQKYADAYKLGDRFIPMFTYERSVRYPEGHRNVVFARRGVRPLPRLPKMPDDSPPSPAPDTQMLYRYLKRFDGICASHTSATNMGTDWRDNDPLVEPAVEIYQGHRQNYEMPGAPRSNNENDSIGGWRPLGFVQRALEKGYRLGFQASSDHISTHMSYCNLWVRERTREGIMEAFRARRIYGATDNILADVRCGQHFMGEGFTVSEPPVISVKLIGAAPLAKVHIIKDGKYVYTTEPNAREVSFSWRDEAAVRGQTSYYYVRGEQSDGELVWVSPMWITWR